MQNEFGNLCTHRKVDVVIYANTHAAKPMSASGGRGHRGGGRRRGRGCVGGRAPGGFGPDAGGR